MSLHFRPLAGAALFATVLSVFPSGAVLAQGAQAPGQPPGQAPGQAPWGAAAAPAATSPTGAPAPADPVVARVDGQDISLSDIAEATQGLPAELRGLPPAQIFPMVMEHLIKQRAMAVLARKSGLDKHPDIRRAMDAAADRALQNAFISREVGPQIADAAIRARYDRDIAGKGGAEEVHARHILVAAQDVAVKIIADLKKGGDFGALAKQHSTDPGAQNGGDLGFFKKDDMVPEFAAAAFALKQGEFTQDPVKTQFGWHVIKLEARRTAAPPGFEEAREELRQRVIQDAVNKLAETALAAVKVERLNTDGSAPRATDGAQPPPAPARR